MSKINIGATLPDFELPDENGVPRRLSELQGDDVSGSIRPRDTLQPANGRISSDGNGIAQLSIVIAMTTPT